MIITQQNVETFTATDEFIYSFGPENSYAGFTPFCRRCGLRSRIEDMREFAKKELTLGNTVILCKENGGNPFRGPQDQEYLSLRARCVAPNNLSNVEAVDRDLETLAKRACAENQRDAEIRAERASKLL